MVVVVVVVRKERLSALVVGLFHALMSGMESERFSTRALVYGRYRNILMHSSSQKGNSGIG